MTISAALPAMTGAATSGLTTKGKQTSAVTGKAMNIVRRCPTNIYRPAMNDNLCGLDRSLGDPSTMRKDPGATADRGQTTAEVSECDQAKACVRGAQGREDEMRRKIQAIDDERKAGGPDRHDEQKAQCADGHGSILEICSPVAIWAVHSRVIRPTLLVFLQVNIEGRIDIYIEHRSKFLRA
ncbi:hypothetical protein [Aurantimonas sp. A3-2-R12]|uniref:hypothetical protein n=1 Tax=Aurantimonas sp. A3-2-R12 TaxID=3114362 RepID=UPI002E18042E|nr:hypothetical protein [Aurantimonas sp. A3-2-R12]